MLASSSEVAEMFNDDSELVGVRDITDEFIENFTGTTYEYDKRKNDVLSKCFNILKSSEKLSFLCNLNEKKVEHFFVLVSHSKDFSSKSIINKALCLWANHMKMKKFEGVDIESLSKKQFAEIQFEPNSMKTMEKMLWAAFRRNVS